MTTCSKRKSTLILKSAQLHSLLKHECISLDRYLNKQLKVIGYKDFTHSDTTVAEVMSYSEWGTTTHTYPVVKVEGLETNTTLVRCFKQINLKNIHLFVAQKTGKSFGWHSDELNVYLYVIKGSKIVQLKNKIVHLCAGQGMILPRRQLHRVMSRKDTWALSIGY